MKSRTISRALMMLLLWTLMSWLAGCAMLPSSNEDVPPASSSPSPVSSSAPAYDAPTVAFCEIVRNPKQHVAKLVRTHAIVGAGREIQFIYDPSCYGKNTLIWIETENKEASIALYDALEAHQGDYGSRRVNGVVVGRLEGPSKEGYGHLNGFKYQFVITAVESVEAVPPEVPWP